jgi:hypothetical protein
VAAITRYVAFALAVGLLAAAPGVECTVDIRPPLLEPAARDGHRDRAIYGWQLMTHEERADFLTRWQAARTPAERDALRHRNHEAMAARARERGVVLPPAPGGTRADDELRPGPLRARNCSEGAQ